MLKMNKNTKKDINIYFKIELIKYLKFIFFLFI